MKRQFTSLPSILRHGCMALSMAAATLQAAPIPPEWTIDDVRVQPSWYGVEVADFPSRVLASGVRESLERFGWGPIRVVEGPERVAVVVGETQGLGDAHFLKEELRLSRVAEGNVIVLQPPSPGAMPRNYYGQALMPAFLPSLDQTPDGPLDPEQIRQRLRNVREIAPEQANLIGEMVDRWEGEDMQDPVLGEGAVAAANFFWEKRVEPEITLYLAGRVARGEWPATAEQQWEAQRLVSDLLYGHRRDWRGAWRAAKAIEGTIPNPKDKAEARMRQAALLVELIDRRVDPAPTLAEVRGILRQALADLPAELDPTEARIKYFYLQTFAWEGNWPRVEQLARVFLREHPPQEQPYASMARVLLAQSLERTQDYDEAKRLLEEVINTQLTDEQMLRLGMETLDPRDVARNAHRYFTQLTAGLDPVHVPPAAPEEQQPEEDEDEGWDEPEPSPVDQQPPADDGLQYME